MQTARFLLATILACRLCAGVASAQDTRHQPHARAVEQPSRSTGQVRFAQPARDGARSLVGATSSAVEAQPVSRRAITSESSTTAGYHALTLDNAASALAAADASPVDDDRPRGHTDSAAHDSEPGPSAAGHSGAVRTPLPPRGAGASRLRNPGPSSARRAPTANLPSLVTVASSLAIVLGLFFVVIVVLRRGNPKGLQLLPREALDILGRTPLPGKQQVYLIRCGGKLLLVGVTPSGAETLTEITEPREVDRLTALCQQGRPESATATFRKMLDELGAEPHAPGFVDRSGPPTRRGLLGGRVQEATHVA